MKNNNEKLNAYQEHETENKGDYKVKENRLTDFLIKVASVLIAFGIWMYAMAMDSTDATATFTAVPVTVEQGESPSLSIISGYDYSVDVTVKGKKSVINKLKTEEIEASIDASSVKGAGKYTLAVNVTVPGGLSVTGQSISTATVYLDNTSSVSVPITVKPTDYMLDNGYTLGTAVPNITEVKVEGPSSELEKIAEARAVIALGHITTSITTNCSLELVDSEGGIVTNPYFKLSADEISVRVPLYVSKDVPVEVDYKYGYWNSENVSIRITPESLRIKGEPALINSISRIKLSPIDEKKAVTDTIVQTITLPDGITNTYGYETATIQISHIGTATKEITIEKFKVVNPDGLKYELNEEFITVKLRGPQNDLPFIGSPNVSATVDLSSYENTPSTVSVPVTIKVGGIYGADTYELGEYRVTVTITE